METAATDASSQMSLGLGLEDAHVLVTGGSGMIGSVVVKAFLAAGCRVSSIDLTRPSYEASSKFSSFTADISNEIEFMDAWSSAVKRNGPIQTCVALASLDLSVLEHHDSLADMSMSQWQRTLNVNVSGTFLTARSWLRDLKAFRDLLIDKPNVSLIIVGSESGHFGERGNPDYAASKSAVQYGLLQSLKADAPRVRAGARVNAIAPGPVATAKFYEECKANPNQLWLDAQGTVAQKRPVSMERIARSIVYLASERWSGDVHGQTLNVDGGKQGKVMWAKDECQSTSDFLAAREYL